MKLSDIHRGDRLIADDGFTCLDEDEICEVLEDADGLYVICRGSCVGSEMCRHYIGDEVAGSEVIGFKFAPPPKS